MKTNKELFISLHDIYGRLPNIQPTALLISLLTFFYFLVKENYNVKQEAREDSGRAREKDSFRYVKTLFQTTESCVFFSTPLD